MTNGQKNAASKPQIKHLNGHIYVTQTYMHHATQCYYMHSCTFNVEHLLLNGQRSLPHHPLTRLHVATSTVDLLLVLHCKLDDQGLPLVGELVERS